MRLGIPVHTCTLSDFIENTSIWKRSGKWSKRKRMHVVLVLMYQIEKAVVIFIIVSCTQAFRALQNLTK